MGGELPDSLWAASNIMPSASQGSGDRLQEKPEEGSLPYAPCRHRLLWVAGRVLLIASFLTGCHRLAPGPEQDAGVEAHSEMNDVSLLLRASKRVYAQGEPLKLTIEVVNHSSGPVTLRFGTAQRYDLLIQNVQGQEVWRWSSVRMFAQVLGSETLSPDGGKITYRAATPVTLPEGAYTVIGVVPAIDTRMSARLEITVQ